MRSTLALSFAAFAGFAAAQTTAQNDYPYQIDPNSVSEANRRMCKHHCVHDQRLTVRQNTGVLRTRLNARSSAFSSPALHPPLPMITSATL